MPRFEAIFGTTPCPTLSRSLYGGSKSLFKVWHVGTLTTQDDEQIAKMLVLSASYSKGVAIFRARLMNSLCFVTLTSLPIS